MHRLHPLPTHNIKRARFAPTYIHTIPSIVLPHTSSSASNPHLHTFTHTYITCMHTQTAPSIVLPHTSSSAPNPHLHTFTHSHIHACIHRPHLPSCCHTHHQARPTHRQFVQLTQQPQFPPFQTIPRQVPPQFHTPTTSCLVVWHVRVHAVQKMVLISDKCMHVYVHIHIYTYICIYIYIYIYALICMEFFNSCMSCDLQKKN
jgi:hypothetical protein